MSTITETPRQRFARIVTTNIKESDIRTLILKAFDDNVLIDMDEQVMLAVTIAMQGAYVRGQHNPTDKISFHNGTEL